ncbi:RagB/SusD family nutrient uptake outer membrane protein, partial [uncultured Mucilaginibacter sp.]|uniref:RagB/SusD family nutrient uptake outer membrane protein n=1 Tax=uncultured Mucilaginibacter sp. TaxID=797541 RepID=UPI00260120A4
MKTSYGKFIALGSLVALTLTYSCKKLLNQAPVGSLNGSVLANKAGLDGLLIGAYSMLDGYGQTSTEWESGIDNWIYGGVGADDAFKGSNTTDQPTAVPIENHTIDPSNEYISEKWSVFYNAVQRANDVIRELPQIKDGSVSPDYAKEVTAEAKFLRGVFHFEL